MIELNLRAPQEFADTLRQVREAMELARVPGMPEYIRADRAYRPLFALHTQLEDLAVFNGWTEAAR